ncbi:MAG: MotA/TolQ/ExbB proton channel family protein [Gemmataceae bacterium]
MTDLPERRSSSTLAAILIGLPLAVGVLAAFHFGPLKQTIAFRYVEWPTQWIEVVFFGIGLGALAVRLLNLWRERSAIRDDLLPDWDGQPSRAERAAELLQSLRKAPPWLQHSILGRRLMHLLGYVQQRKSAAGLDEQMRTAADTDAIHHDGDLAFYRFIVWALPMLGFLGTVIGITAAIGGITPEKLEGGMTELANGLAEAFDSTALALGCTMALMFFNFLVEREENALLAAIDEKTERLLAHRFQIDGETGSPLLDAVRQQGAMIAGALRDFHTGPGSMAVQAFEQIQKRIVQTLATALEQTLIDHTERLSALETQSVAQSTALMQQLTQLASSIQAAGQQQKDALLQVAQAVMQQAAVLAQLQEGEAHLIQLQSVLQQNLAALTAAGNFEQAVHSLTAAVHMLTARAGVPGPRLSNHGNAA